MIIYALIPILLVRAGTESVLFPPAVCSQIINKGLPHSSF